MKNGVRLCLTIIIFATASAKAQWSIVGEQGFTGLTHSTKIKTHPFTNEPWIIHRETAQPTPFTASVRRFNGSEWEYVGEQGFSGTDISGADIAFSLHGTPYVVFADHSNHYSATVMKFNGSDWQVVGKRGITGVPSSYVSIQIDKAGTPYIAFMEGKEMDYRAAVMCFNGSEWEFVGKRAFTNDKAINVSLTLDNHGVPYIAYQEYNAQHDLISTVSRFNGQEWEYVGQPGFADWNANITRALAFDSQNRPYITCLKNGVTTGLRFENGDWREIGTPLAQLAGSEYATIAIDSRDIPYITFQDYATNQKPNAISKLSVIRCINKTWEFVGKQGCSPDPAIFVDMAIDREDNIYTIYANSNVASTVMKYSDPTVSVKKNRIEKSILSIYPNPAKGSLSVSFQCDRMCPAELRLINQQGQTVFQKQCSGPVSETIDVSGYSKGVYFLEVNGETRETKRIVIE